MAITLGPEMKETSVIPSVHIKTFGCQMNKYDSDRMGSLLLKEGFRWEEDVRQADVILINTCAIRDKSEHKVLSLLGQLKPLKDQDPKKVIGVAGCVGQRMGRHLLQRVPHLDIVTGPDGIDRIGSMVKSVREAGTRVLDAKLDAFDPTAGGRHYTQPAVVMNAKPAEYITIMKGCDHFCAYCIVPFVRGREKSRSIAEVIADAEKFVAAGTKEITFLGQNINTYGKGGTENLAQLIEAANKISGLERIRYVTSHPRDLGQDLIEQFGTVEKLMPSLHLPFQSGSNDILKRMSRLYTREMYLEKVAALRKARPDIAMTGDVIVGFPGETDADFEQTLSLVREVRFANLFMFKYSPRPGTKAFAAKDEISEELMDVRLKILQKVVYGIVNELNDLMVGRTVKCLVESMDRKGRYYSGRTPHTQIVHVLNAGPSCVGKIIDVEITESRNSNLRGYYVDAPRTDRLGANRSEAALSASV